TSSMIDAVGGFAYFVGIDGIIAKINLGTFLESSSLNLGEGMGTSVIDTVNNLAYIASYSFAKIKKVDLAGLMSFVEDLTLNAEETIIISAVIDTAANKAYFGTSPGSLHQHHIVKIDTSPLVSPTRDGAILLEPGENNFRKSVIDQTNGFGYFITGNLPARITKVNLSTFLRADSLLLDESFGAVLFGLIDETHQFAYFISGDNKITKLDLSSFTILGTAALATPQVPDSAVIDSVDEYIYLGTGNPRRIYKIDAQTLTLGDIIGFIGAPTLETDYSFTSAVIDTSGPTHYAYFAGGTNDAQTTQDLVKINLTGFTKVSEMNWDISSAGGVLSGIIDTTNQLAYFLSGDKIAKIALGVGDAAPSQISSLTLPITTSGFIGNQDYFDSATNFAYFLTNNTRGDVIKIDLTGFTYNSTLAATTASGYGTFVFQNSTSKIFAATANPGKIIKASAIVTEINPKYIRGTKASLTLGGGETAYLSKVDFYSHTLSAPNTNIKLAIYSGTNLLWSATTTITAAGAWKEVPISSGTPNTLSLASSGDYYLAYQVDAATDTSGYLGFSPGDTVGDGFVYEQDYGAFPSNIYGSNLNLTTDRWSIKAEYSTTAPNTNPQILGLGGVDVTGGGSMTNLTPSFNFSIGDADVGDAAQFKIQIAKDSPDFSSIYMDYVSGACVNGPISFHIGGVDFCTGPGAVLPAGYVVTPATTDLVPGTYYWRVIAADQNGGNSGWVYGGCGAVADVCSSPSFIITAAWTPAITYTGTHYIGNETTTETNPSFTFDVSGATDAGFIFVLTKNAPLDFTLGPGDPNIVIIEQSDSAIPLPITGLSFDISAPTFGFSDLIPRAVTALDVGINYFWIFTAFDQTHSGAPGSIGPFNPLYTYYAFDSAIAYPVDPFSFPPNPTTPSFRVETAAPPAPSGPPSTFIPSTTNSLNSILPLPLETNINGEVVNTLASANSVDFGQLLANNKKTTGFSFSVSSDSQFGYTMFISQDHDLSSSDGKSVIEGFNNNGGAAPTNAHPQLWVSPDPSVTKGFLGYSTNSITLSNTDNRLSDRFSTGGVQKYAKITSNFSEISRSSGPVKNDLVDLLLKLEVNSRQESANYSNHITITILSNL
ncbi:MAG: hypothetical protein PHU42_00005, partial [Patescibacteria group bacterium]|nr:hypothetical protein [Patescibacteria group bacterium]